MHSLTKPFRLVVEGSRSDGQARRQETREIGKIGATTGIDFQGH